MISNYLKFVLIYPIILIIKLYQVLLSPIIKTNCRFSPSCSEYAIIALKEHGLVKGFYLSILRILRCNPFGNHGYDPVPKKTSRNT